MDASLVIDVLNDALEKYGVPEIFNTDQAKPLRGNLITPWN